MDWIQRNFRTLIYISFLIPILLVAFVSISHVTTWYGLSNPLTWAIYLSIGIEIAALSALAAISASMGKKVYVPFGIVTLIQFIGNIFFAYQYIDINSEQFKDWVELVDPVVSYLGVESGNIISHKRFLSLFAGGMLPIISLSFLHMLVKFEEEEKSKQVVPSPEIDIEKLSTEAGKLEAEFENNKITPTEEELKTLENFLIELDEKKFKSSEEDRIESVIINQNVSEKNLGLESQEVESEKSIENLSIEAQVTQDTIEEIYKSEPDEIQIVETNDLEIPKEELHETIEVEPDFYAEEKPDYNLTDESTSSNSKILRYFRSH